MEFGIAAFGSALGKRTAVADVVHDYTEDTARVLGQGYHAIHVAGQDVGLTDLAVDAAASALADAGVTADEVDLVVLAITDIPEHLYWDASAALAHRLRATRAEAVLVDQGCIGGITALDLVAGRLATHPDYETALVVGANRTCEQYWNRLETHSLLFSDGAAAALVRRDHGRLRWRVTETMTDGAHADHFRLDTGGASAPFGRGSATPRARDAWDVMEAFDFDADRFTAFVDEMNDRVRQVVERATARIGRSTADLARLVMLNDNARTLADVAGRLDIPMERTNAAFSLDHGHFGAADFLLGLGHLAASGVLADGDLVALAGMGRGMHWSAALLEV